MDLLRFANQNASLMSRIKTAAADFDSKSDVQLQQQFKNLQFEAMAGKQLNDLIVPCFALACVTIQRATGLKPYPTQIRAAIELCRPCIVEMATGEGKTLTALMPVLLKSLDRKGLYFATSNDYLAKRDAQHAQKVFERLGITVGCIEDSDEDDARRVAYQCDIVYGTTSQFGFDFLRDRAKKRFADANGPSPETEPVGRSKLNSIIIDEADGLLIDEAVTPLLISSQAKPLPDFKSRLYTWAQEISAQAEQTKHYTKNEIKDKIDLTNAGRAWARKMAQTLRLEQTSMLDLFDYVERAILVNNDFIRDKKYIVRDGEIIIVDENTGRLGVGRQWGHGLQQAIQAKENLEIMGEKGHLAKVSIQSFVRSFKHLSGMTGTAVQSSREFKKIYKLQVKPIPTYRKNLRIQLPTIAFPDRATAFGILCDEVESLAQQGRPILVGTRTIKISEQLSAEFSRRGIDHTLLNAKNDEAEADIISQAGCSGQITIATNMAGRGTDIKLDPVAEKAGGLHVFVLGIHNSPRIDRQLIGRCARQGDPGSFRIVLFLDDDLLDYAWGPVRAEQLRADLKKSFSEKSCIALIRSAQKTISSRMETSRAAMLEQERKTIKKLANAGLDPVLEIPG